MLIPLTAQQTLERARSVLESGRGASLPELLKLIETLSLNLAEVTVSELAELIEKDAVILTRVIAVANTLAHNPGIAPLATVSHAIHRLGYNRIRTIAVSLMLLETAGSSSTTEQRDAAAIALGSGLVAQGLAISRGTHDPELAFACAALRNFGRIIMAALSPEHAREAIRRARELSDADAHLAVFGLTSVELSRQLLSSGRLPEEVVRTLRDYEPETLGSSATTFDTRLIGLADLGGRLATLALDAREGPDAFNRKSAELHRRFARVVPDAIEHTKHALHYADQRLSSYSRCNGVRTLPTVSLRRIRLRLDDLSPSTPRADAADDTTAPLAPAPDQPLSSPTLPAVAAPNHEIPPAYTPAAPLVAVPAPDPWLAALTGARDAASADLCWVFLPVDGGPIFSLARRSDTSGLLPGIASATFRTAERNVFGVCLSRLEIVVIHDTGHRTIAPYLPTWWPELRAKPDAFAILPVRTDATVHAVFLVGWHRARRIALGSDQASTIERCAHRALALASEAAAAPLPGTRTPFAA